MARQTFHVCYHCKDRHIGCHSNCERYLKEVEENEKIKKEKDKQAMIKSTLYECTGNRLRSISKSRNEPR